MVALGAAPRHKAEFYFINEKSGTLKSLPEDFFTGTKSNCGTNGNFEKKTSINHANKIK